MYKDRDYKDQVKKITPRYKDAIFNSVGNFIQTVALLVIFERRASYHFTSHDFRNWIYKLFLIRYKMDPEI